MGCYLRSGAGLPELWSIDVGTAVRVGVTNPENGAGTFFQASAGETIWDAIRRQAPSWFEPDGESPFDKTVLEPGEFYPRIARPMQERAPSTLLDGARVRRPKPTL